MKKETDDFVWREYTERYYIDEVDEVVENSGLIIKKSYVKDGDVVYRDPIHPNCAMICNDAVRLGIKSAFECGCSCGYHLYNIKKLLPKVTIAGCDLLKTQVYGTGYKLGIPNSITENIQVMDFSEIGACENIDSKYEYVFTNAVLMHLSYGKAVGFVKNMVGISSKYLRFSESCSDFEELLEEAGVLDTYKRKEDFLFSRVN